MYLRTYREEDAAVIAGWIKNERAFRQWSADRYERYPVCPEDINRQYAGYETSDRFFPVTACDESGVVGHMILRFPGEDRKIIRFGFIIVDDSKRGMGYGKQMLSLAVQYAMDTFGVNKITLGVFENNPAAYHCYRAAGFQEIWMEQPEYYHVMGEDWKCLEMERKG